MFYAAASMFLLLSIAINTVVCQTFQYSHGWTNGKRTDASVDEVAPKELQFNSPIAASVGEGTKIPTNYELQKLRVLLQACRNDQLYALPYELLGGPKKNSPRIYQTDQFRRGAISEMNN